MDWIAKFTGLLKINHQSSGCFIHGESISIHASIYSLCPLEVSILIQEVTLTLSLNLVFALTEFFPPSYTNHSLKYRIWVQPYPIHETDPDFTLKMILTCLNQKPSLDSWA